MTEASPADCFVSYPGYSLWSGVLPLCWDSVGVFCSPSRLGELKVLQYSCNERHNLIASDEFAEVLKVTNHTRLWVVELAWYSPSASRWIWFNGLEHGLGIYGFRLDRRGSWNPSETSWTRSALWLTASIFFTQQMFLVVSAIRTRKA